MGRIWRSIEKGFKQLCRDDQLGAAKPRLTIPQHDRDRTDKIDDRTFRSTSRQVAFRHLHPIADGHTPRLITLQSPDRHRHSPESQDEQVGGRSRYAEAAPALKGRTGNPTWR